MNLNEWIDDGVMGVATCWYECVTNIASNPANTTTKITIINIKYNISTYMWNEWLCKEAFNTIDWRDVSLCFVYSMFLFIENAVPANVKYCNIFDSILRINVFVFNNNLVQR